MGRLVQSLDKILYPGIENHWDDRLFRKFIIRHLRAEYWVLDLGAGAGIVSEMNFKGLAQKVCGLDPDPRVMQNPYLDEAHIGWGENIPYLDKTFDLVFADNMLEHVADPGKVFREVWRVLKPGGKFLAKTPNRRHYMPLIARLSPQGMHRFINRLRGRQEDDTFPTYYAINTPEEIRNQAESAGFEVSEICLTESRPEYCRLSAFTYLIGWAYERLVNTIPGLECYRILMIAVLEKPG
jgi:SAM-dependent methyltransferase